jgi:hypothetical protein
VTALLNAGASPNVGSTLGMLGWIWSESPLNAAGRISWIRPDWDGIPEDETPEFPALGDVHSVTALLEVGAHPDVGGTVGPLGILWCSSPLWQAEHDIVDRGEMRRMEQTRRTAEFRTLMAAALRSGGATSRSFYQLVRLSAWPHFVTPFARMAALVALILYCAEHMMAVGLLATAIIGVSTAIAVAVLTAAVILNVAFFFMIPVEVLRRARSLYCRILKFSLEI